MPRVGILTWYSYRNYGTVLQAYALQRALSTLGCQPYDVSYDPLLGVERHEAPQRTLLERVSDKVKWKLGYRPVMTEGREATFDDFIRAHLSLTEPVATDDDFAELNSQFDCFVCGSDQVWSPRCFDPRYYLDFVEGNHRKIAYAPSFGCDTLDGFVYANEIEKLLRGFGALSVRETTGVRIIRDCTGEDPAVVLDPTLLLSGDAWRTLCAMGQHEKKGYCLFYFLGTFQRNRGVARKIAKARGLRVVDIPVFQRDLRRDESPSYPVGPSDFLSLLEGADCVCTDSFHGMAFASIFSKELYAFERFDPGSANSQNTRIYSFLNMAGMKDALLRRCDLAGWRGRLALTIDYESVRKRIAAKREESFGYLRHSLEDATGTKLCPEEG